MKNPIGSGGNGKEQSVMGSGLRRRAGFTLIELLVVIAIIAILAAILFPVFAQAREKARAATCISNGKQMGLAMMMYSQDYDECYVPGYYAVGSNEYWWLTLVQPYMKEGSQGGLKSQLRSCPSAPSKAWAYAMNDYLNFKNQSVLPNVADTVLISDTNQIPEWDMYSSSTLYVWWKPEAWNPKPASNFAKGDPNASLVDIDTDTNPAKGYIRYRHNEGANIVWADGHVKYTRKGSLKLKQFRYEFQNQ
jgi:prepilin-type N-terminal cleavage/methylation domain-containing protein/prepilin-type processing-associated H-X9-DG protein